MVGYLRLLQIIYAIMAIASSSAAKEKKTRRKNDYQDKALWKKEYEAELNDAMLATRKRENVTRVVQSAGSDNEAVIDKLMESITSSEKYLKKVDSIDFRLNRLDIEVHEKTNSILKYLAEIMKTVRSQSSAEKLDTLLDSMKAELTGMKSMVEKVSRASLATESVDGREPHLDAALEARLSFLEGNVKSVLSGVETIVTTINEVKNRQHTRANAKTNNGATNSMDALSLITEFRRTLQEQKPKKCECKSNRVDRSERYPTDCHEIQMQGFNVSGIYKIKPDDMDPFYVLCDLTTAGGGWTVFQNRFDGSQDFFKGWSDYKHGFGNLAGEFWLGLEKLHYLTNQKLYELRIEFETQNGHEAYAAYSVFTIGPEYEGYRISTLGTFYGSGGDSLSYHAGQKFSSPDVDNDDWKDGSCAVEHGGAWWYKECDKSNLNGIYSLTADEHRGQTIYWISFKGPNFPLTKTKMMIRPLPASRPNDFSDQTGKPLDIAELRGIEKQVKPSRPGNSPMGKVRPETYRYNEPPVAEAFFNNYA